MTSLQTTFIGRQREIAALRERLANPNCRLLTVYGLGGVGKTRVAQALLDAGATDFADGAHFISLEAVETEEHLLSALAAEPGVSLPGSGDDRAALFAALRDRRSLLVLDNFEQLVDDESAVSLIGDLLAHTRYLKLLVTSRVALNVQDEWRFPLEGLAVDDDAGAPGDALRLFAERAARVRPDFNLAREIEPVRRLCRMVGGLPLAIELAAAWTKSFAPAVIVDELMRDLGRMETTLRDLPERHRSLAAVKHQTWHRLTEEEQRVFARLSVFPSTFDHRAAQDVAGADLRLLDGLVDKAIVQQTSNGRYRLHEYLRQYAAARLAEQGETADIRERHRRYFTRFMGERRTIQVGEDPTRAHAELAAELDNLRRAIDTAIDQGSLDTLHNATRSIVIVFQARSQFNEGVTTWRRVARYLAGRDDPAAAVIRADALVYYGWLLLRVGETARARSLFEESWSLVQAHQVDTVHDGAADPRAPLALTYVIQGDYETARRIGRETLDAHRDETWPSNRRYALYALANAERGRGDLAAAQRYAEQTLAATLAMNARWFLAYVHILLGDIAALREDRARARDHFQTALSLRDEFNDHGGRATAHNYLGRLALVEGDLAAATKHFSAARETYQRVFDAGGKATAVYGLGVVSLRRGDYPGAQCALQEALTTALNITFATLMLDVFLAAAELFLAAGASEKGEALVAYFLQHGPDERRDAARALLPPAPVARLPTLLPSELTEAAYTLLDWLATPLPVAAPRRAAPRQPLVDPLTPRELEVLRLMADGLTNPQIAARLIVSVGTIKAHNHNIYSKLGVHNRTQAVNRARELALLNAT